ncbi:hypothetical protein BsWGS_12531 [Bradybaena similaris]
MCGRTWIEYSLWIYIAGSCVALGVMAQQSCDQVFANYRTDQTKGEFASPGYPDNYPDDVSCKYKFIGKSNQRIKIKFTNFALQGRPPTCPNDFVNIYSQLKHESDDLLDAEMSGPFCGDTKEDLPKLVVSTRNVLVIWFYSNENKNSSGFNGTWEFIDAVHYEMGTMAPHSCGYTIRSENKRQGYIMSPTYPGVYPDNFHCTYKLQGKPGQRIKLIFQDFLLFYGGEYCPFDYLRIHDGHTNSPSTPVIGTFCGSFNQSTVIYSRGEALWLDFVTGEGRLNFTAPPLGARADFKFDRRGFNISYIFSEDFVKLDENFIKDGAQHVLGTLCDLRIMSGKETNGTFVSPGFPGSFKEGLVCRYYMDGLMDKQNLEKVKVNFYDFNIPGNMPYCLLGFLGENEDARLSEGAVKNKYCGSYNPPIITSIGPRMVITLNTTGAIHGGKFFAKYAFITDYDIHGEQIEEGKCKFHYNNARDAQGFVNSPRHPNEYPLSLECEYIFRPLPDHFVVISFSVFVMSQESSPSCDIGDYIAFYDDMGTLNRENFTATERYCGYKHPGPYATSRLLKLIFHSDGSDSHVGFKATYKFISRHDIDTTCSTTHPTRGPGGVITPNFQIKSSTMIMCEWVLQASKKDHRILVEVRDINLEGAYGRNGERASCSDVAIRLYTDSNSLSPVELLCGKKTEEDEVLNFTSVRDSFKISFLTSSTYLGAKYFKISYTELYYGPSPTMDCPGFRCLRNKYCISPSLKCNNQPNCGKGDDSDETTACSKPSGIQILHIAIGTSISSFFCIILLICGFYHRRKFRSDRAPPDHDHVEVRYVSAPTGCNTTDRLLMEDRNDIGNDHHNHTSTQSPRCQKVSMV